LHDRHFTLLTSAARAGDRSALGHLLSSFQTYLQLFADDRLAADLRQKCAASDLVQQTFLEAQRAFPRFQGSKPHELRAWLERILLNNLGDVARKFREVSKRQIASELPLASIRKEALDFADLSTPSKSLLAREEQERLQRALSRIRDDYRRVIVMRNFDRRSFDDIALEFGRSADAIKKLWSRAIVQLKQEMERHDRPSSV
jgi:RNA polymerase sigma-70 factor (ECF subfamily)